MLFHGWNFRVEPPLWFELFRIWPPDILAAVGGRNPNRDGSTFFDQDACSHVAGYKLYGLK